MNEASATRIAARCTAILDSVDFPRITPVVWDEDRQAFVVIYAEDGVERVKFLGTGGPMAVQAARRERAKALAPERRRNAAEAFQGFVQVLGVIMPLFGAVIPLVKPGK